MRSGVEGAEQHRPGARHTVRDGPGGFAGPLQPPGELRVEDGHRRYAQVARRGLHTPLAGRDGDECEVAWKALNNIDPERDIQFVMGPVDSLDHSSRLVNYGSKMGIDATRKWPGEGF